MNRHRLSHDRSTLLRRLWQLTIALATAMSGASGAASAGEWHWTVTPYAWATDVGVEVAVADRARIEETITVAELMEDLETIAQVRVEAQNGEHGLFLDLFDVNLSDEATTVVLPRGGTATFSPEMGMTIAELGGLYDPHGDRQGFQLLYGVRLLNERATIDAAFSPPVGAPFEHQYELDDTMLDGLVGVRFVHRLGDRWSVAAAADASAGGTDFTWSASPTIGYTFGETGRYALTGGYRYMEVDFADQREVEARMTLSGFIAGLRIAF